MEKNINEIKMDIMGMEFPCIVAVVDTDKNIGYGVFDQYHLLGVCVNANEAINRLNDVINSNNGIAYGHCLYAKSMPINSIGYIGSSFYKE